MHLTHATYRRNMMTVTSHPKKTYKTPEKRRKNHAGIQKRSQRRILNRKFFSKNLYLRSYEQVARTRARCTLRSIGKQTRNASNGRGRRRLTDWLNDRLPIWSGLPRFRGSWLPCGGWSGSRKSMGGGGWWWKWGISIADFPCWFVELIKWLWVFDANLIIFLYS